MDFVVDKEKHSPGDSGDQPPLGRWECSTRDGSGEPVIEWDEATWAEWSQMRAPLCPDGHFQRRARPLGFRERNVGELELRIALGGDDIGVCDVIVDEREDEIYVRVLVCMKDDEDDASPARNASTDCPVRVWLERPLGERAVIDIDSDEELPLYIPHYLNNIPQAGHGYHVVSRRRC